MALESSVRGVLGMRTDTPAMLESMQAISVFFDDKGSGSSTLEARRSLRDDLERQNSDLTNCFLKSVERLRQRVRALEGHVHGLEDGCDSIRDRLATADTHMKEFTKAAQGLKCQREALQQRAEQVAVFVQKFQLSDAEVAALEEPLDKDNGKAFFVALDRLKSVRHESSMLVGGRHQNAAFELLDSLSQHQEVAYERLYKWVQGRASKLTDEHPQTDATIQSAMGALLDQPMYYAHCQETFIGVRRKQVVQRFVLALTQGGGGATTKGVKPIELLSHDTVRYVGDMLAWVHQALALEREVAEAWFGAATRDQLEQAETTPRVLNSREVLSHIMEGVAAPLGSRVGTVLADIRDTVVAYRLVSYLVFYSDMIGQLVEPQTALGKALLGVRAKGHETFLSLLSNAGAKLRESRQPANLSTTHEGISILVELLGVHSSSLMSPAAPEYSIRPVIAAIVEPMLEAAKRCASNTIKSDGCILLLNNCGSIRAALEGKEEVEEWVARLQAEEETCLAQLVQDQAGRVLERCGMNKIVKAIETSAPVNEAATKEAVEAYYSALFGLSLTQFEALENPAIKAEAREKTAQAIAKAHTIVYNAVKAPSGGYSDDSFLVHTPDQVKLLVDCE
ncbi:unnamed protein product [Chrysoparadoxa australica]